MAGLQIRETWFRVERSLGLIDEATLSVERSGAAIQRSRARLAMTDPHTLRRLFAARMDRERPVAGVRPPGDGSRTT